MIKDVLEPLLGVVVSAAQSILVNGLEAPVTSTSSTGLVTLCTCALLILFTFDTSKFWQVEHYSVGMQYH